MDFLIPIYTAILNMGSYSFWIFPNSASDAELGKRNFLRTYLLRPRLALAKLNWDSFIIFELLSCSQTDAFSGNIIKRQMDNETHESRTNRIMDIVVVH